MQLINEISANSLELVRDAYGNYVVQYILELRIDGLDEELARRFSGHIAMLAGQKFSSNVIEKVIKNSLIKKEKHV